MTFLQRGLLTPQDMSTVDLRAEGEEYVLAVLGPGARERHTWYLRPGIMVAPYPGIREKAGQVLERKNGAASSCVGKGLLLIAISLIKHR